MSMSRLGYIADNAATRITDPIPERLTEPPQPEPMRGLGDLVHAVLDRIGVVGFVKRREERTKRDCGCKARREAMNRAVPFTGSRSPQEPSAPASG